MKNSEPQDYFP